MLNNDATYIIEDVTQQMFENVEFCNKFDVIDNRHIRNRFDDVLMIYHHI